MSIDAKKLEVLEKALEETFQRLQEAHLTPWSIRNFFTPHGSELLNQMREAATDYLGVLETIEQTRREP